MFLALLGCTTEAPSTFSQHQALGGTWSPAGNLAEPRGLFSTELRAIAVNDGRVLVAGGANVASQSSVSILDSSNGTPSPGLSLSVAREMAGPVALGDGGALIAGGQNRAGLSGTVLKTIDRWDSSTGKWTAVGDMTTPRAFLSATRLADGRVLLLGGMASYLGSVLASGEIFDPMNNQSLSTNGAMTFARFGHVAALLPSGKVFVAGGNSVWGGNTPPRKTEIFDPSSGTFSPGPDMVALARVGHAGARLVDGRVLYCGGCTSGNCGTVSVKTCEIYDGQSGKVAGTGSLTSGSGAQSMVTLATGKVLIAGGISQGAALDRVEIYDPQLGTWSSTGILSQERYDAAIALLVSGKVAIAGGRFGPTTMSTYVSSVEVYEPSGVPITCRVCQLDGTCTKLSNGIACDDGNPCTVSEQCSGGECLGTGSCADLSISSDLTPAPSDLSSASDLSSPNDLSSPASSGDLSSSPMDGAVSQDLVAGADLSLSPQDLALSNDLALPAADLFSFGDLSSLPDLFSGVDWSHEDMSLPPSIDLRSSEDLGLVSDLAKNEPSSGPDASEPWDAAGLEARSPSSQTAGCSVAGRGRSTFGWVIAGAVLWLAFRLQRTRNSGRLS